MLKFEDMFEKHKSSVTQEDREQINKAIQRAVVRGRIQRQSKNRKVTYVSFSALISMVLIISIWTTTPIGAYVGQLPFVQQIKDMFYRDEGLLEAVENNYEQQMDASDKHNGIEFTVDNMITDEYRTVIFYTISDTDAQWKERDYGIEFVDADSGKVLKPLSIISGDGNRQNNQTKSKRELIWANVSESPKNIIVNMKVYHPVKPGYMKKEPLEHVWSVTLPVTDQTSLFSKKIAIDKTIEIDGQIIVLKKLSLLPTVIRLDVVIDPSNTKQIFAFENLKLSDGEGKVWEPLPLYHPDRSSYVFPYTENNADEITIYFEGSYFSDPSSILLQADGMRAIEKNKREVIVDFEQKKLIKAPDDRLQLKELNLYPRQLEIIFELPSLHSKKRTVRPINLYPLFSYHDKDRIYPTTISGTTSEEENRQTIDFTTKGEDLQEQIQNPLRFIIVDYHYDKYIEDIEVKIH